MRKVVLLALAVLAVLALVVGGIRGWRALQLNDFQRAVSLVPEDAQRLSWTDWAGVRREVGSDIGASSSGEEVEDFLAEAFETDATSMSALLESAPTLQEEFGFSPATLEWELLTQSGDGAAVLMQLPEDTDMDAVADTLEELGFERPEEDTGVWRGGIDLLPRIGTLTPELQYLGVDADHQRVVGSDTLDYAARAMASSTGDGPALDGLDGVVDAAGDPLAAAVYDSEVACRSLAMSSAGESDQAEADDLLAAAGEVNPLTGFSMALEPGLGVRVAMSFETEEQARTNADTRAALASGPAPGQGGDFSDRFALGAVTAEGEVVTMDLEPGEGEYILSDLTSGPVLFATC